MDAHFTIDQARALMPELRQRAERIVRLRADLADAQAALSRGSEPTGGIPEAKSLEAHLQETIDWFGDRGIHLKGIAPLIADLPSELAGERVLLCWLEGETSLDWYHRPEVGFIGRRRLPDAS
ncbi:MAG: DUF2203 family protein [Nitriliruptorales bacterium]|nr:DUF2203 family protein [Nitriliruptorales bacterium]